MILINELDSVKALAEVQANLIPGGVMYGVIEGDTATWVKSSDSLDIDVLHVGKKLDSNSTMLAAIREKKVISQSIQRSVYGTRLVITSIPILDEENNAVGAFAIAIPKFHPVAASFRDFAPIIAEMFPEGANICVFDLQKVIDKQASKKFDITSIKIGTSIIEDSIVSRAIRTGKHIIEEVDSSMFGVNALEAAYPLFDVDNPDEIVGLLDIITPKELAVNLRNMSENLESGLTGIASAIEELAASASNIHTNEIELHNEIKNVITLSEEINEVSSFIKEIADETKMLGLNAAIEAARAGDAGRGFGVVAEEIRKLSEQSKSTVPKIKKLTDNIKSKVNATSERSESSLASSQEQAAASEEITASIEELTSMSQELNKIAQEI
jgi:hypothetical protein